MPCGAIQFMQCTYQLPNVNALATPLSSLQRLLQLFHSSCVSKLAWLHYTIFHIQQ